MARRKRMDEDDDYGVLDGVPGGITQLTDDVLTESEKRKERVRLRSKGSRPVGFRHPTTDHGR